MKKQLNEEFKRMQKLAGIKLNENKASDLISDGVVLYVSDDSKLAPKFIKPKKIGFIVYDTSVKIIQSPLWMLKGTLAKNQKVVQIFNDNYGVIDVNYITTFLTNPNNWKVITSEDELNDFMSKYSKIYLINHNGDSSEIEESLNEGPPVKLIEVKGSTEERIDTIISNLN
jgi:hypothetical protein